MKNIKTLFHKRTIVAITLGVALLIGSIYFVSRFTVMSGFRTLEEKFLKKNIARSQEALADRLNNLVVKLSDWAVWDDSYAFIEDKNEAYIKSNLTSIALDTLKIDAMAFFNSNEKLIYALTLDPDRKTIALLSKGLTQWFVKGNPLFKHADAESPVTGIVMLPEGPMLLASKPIVKSNGEGPGRGTLIFAKYLDQNEQESLSTLIGVKLDVKNFAAVSLPPDFDKARQAFLTGKETFIHALSPQTIAGYSTLKDLYGKTVLILKIAMPREITQFGILTMRYVFVALIFVGFIFGVIVYLPLQREIVGRDLAEKAASREQIFNQIIIESIPGAFYVLDANGRYFRWNAYQRDQIVGKPDSQMPMVYAKDTIHPEDRALVISKIENVLKNGIEEIVEGRVLLRGGPAFRWLLMTGRRMIVQGNPVLIGTGIDITERKKTEEALSLSKAKLDLALKSAQMGVWEFNIAEDRRFFDHQTCVLLGLDPAAFSGTSEEFFGAIHPEDREKVKAALAHTVAAGGLYQPEYRIIRPDGSIRHITSRGELVRDDKGNPKKINGIIWDITERNLAEDQVRASEKFLYNIINSIADPIFVKDRQHRWVILNDVFCRFMGHPREELIGKSDYDFFSKKEADVFWSKDEVVFESEEENTNEEEFTDAQGVTHVIMTKKSTYKNPQGQKILIGVIHDITEQRKKEAEERERLREMEIFYKASIGREERIIELKEEIKTLREELGK